MEERKMMISAVEIADELGISKSRAYALIRKLNDELKNNGYITISGKLPYAYWITKMYGEKGGS